MRAEQINSLRKGNSQLLFEFVNKYKDDISSLITAIYINKKNQNKINDADFLQICTNAIINAMKYLNNAPSGYNFRNWLLKTVYKNEFFKASKKEEQNKSSKTWKSFTVIKTSIERNTLQQKIFDLPINQRLAIWASCHENMSLEDASKFFDLDEDVYLETLIQGLQGVRSRFPSKTNKVPDTVNYRSLVSNIYNTLSTSDRIEVEKELENHKVKLKFHESINKEKTQFKDVYKKNLPGKDLLANIRANTRLVRKRLIPYFLISFELLIFLFIVFLIIYISSQVAPPEISVAVDKGSVSITPKEPNLKPRTIFVTLPQSEKTPKSVLNVGDIVETKAYSSASFTINNTNTMQLGSSSKIEILKQTGNFPVAIKLYSGTAWFEVVNSNEKTKITTDNTSFSTNGGEFIIEANSKSDSVLVFEGEIEIIDSKIEGDITGFKKNNAFAVNDKGEINRITNNLIRNSSKDDKFHFSIDTASKYYFNENGKLKVLFHWLNSRDYPFEINNNPGIILEELDKFYRNFSSYNNKLTKLKEAHNRARTVVERMYASIRKVEKQYNSLIKESELILLNQVELENLYLEFQKVKNNCSSLRTSSYKNITFTDFSHNQKRVYSTEDEHWQSEIKKLRESSLQLSTFETIKQGLDIDLKNINTNKTNIETELRKLTIEFDKAQNAVKAIEKSKEDRANSLVEIDKLDAVLVELKTTQGETQKTLNELNEKLDTLNKSIEFVENINKKVDEILESLKISKSDLANNKSNKEEILRKINLEQTKIDNSNKGLLQLKNDKDKYDSELAAIDKDIENTTNAFNQGLKDRTETTEKVNNLKKQVALIDIKINELESKETDNNNEITKKEKLIETQSIVIARYKEQIEGYNNEINTLQNTFDENQVKIEEIKSKLTSLIEDKSSKSKEISELKELIIETKGKISTANETLVSLNDQLEKLSITKEEYTKQDSEFAKLREEQETNLKDTESLLTIKSEELNSTKKLSTDADVKLMKMMSEKSKIESEIKKSKENEKKTNDLISALEQEIYIIQRTMISKFIVCKCANSKSYFVLINKISDLRKLKSELKQTQQRVEGLEAKLPTISDKIKAEEGSVNDYKELLEELSSAINELNKKKNDQILKLELLKQDLLENSDKLTDINTKIEKLTTKKEETENAVETLKNTQLEQEEKSLNLSKQIEEIETSLEVLDNESATLTESINTTNESKKEKELLKSNIQKKLDKFQEVKDKTKADLDDLMKVRDSLNSDKEKILKDKKVHTDQYDEFEKTLQTQKEQIFKHQSKLNDLKNKRIELKEIADPITKKYSALENVITLSKQILEKLEADKSKLNNQITELESKIEALNNSINSQEELLKEHKSLTDLNTEKANITSIIGENQKSFNEIKNQIINTENKINDHKLTIINSDKLLITEETAKQKLQEVEEKLGAQKILLNQENSKLSKTQDKISEIQTKIDDLKKQLNVLKAYENYSEFWTQYYNEVIKVETALQLSAFKYETLEKRIKTLESEVGEQVYQNKLSEIRSKKAKLNELIDQYKIEDKKFWYITQILNSAEGNSPDSITSNINALVLKTATELLPILYDYEELKLDKETKIKIISDALFLYPEYRSLGSISINSERLAQINDTWRLKLMKIFEQNNLFDQINTLTDDKLILPR